MPSPLRDTTTAIDEGGWGSGPSHLSKARRERCKRWEDKWRKAFAVRADWPDSAFVEEEARLEAEIAAILAARKAADGL